MSVPRSPKQLVEEIDKLVPAELSPADAYRTALGILVRELRAYDDIIWRPMDDATIHDVKAGRARLMCDVEVLQALLARQLRMQQ